MGFGVGNMSSTYSMLRNTVCRSVDLKVQVDCDGEEVEHQLLRTSTGIERVFADV